MECFLNLLDLFRIASYCAMSVCTYVVSVLSHTNYDAAWCFMRVSANNLASLAFPDLQMERCLRKFDVIPGSKFWFIRFYKVYVNVCQRGMEIKWKHLPQ